MAAVDTVTGNRVIMVETAGKGGICHYTYNLCQGLVPVRDVLLLTGKAYELAGRPRGFEVEGLFNRFRTNPLFIFGFWRLIRRPGVRIVHFQLSQYPAFTMALAAAAVMAGKRVVITSHNVISHEQQNWGKWVYSALYRIAHRVIVHAQANKAELISLFQVDPAKVAVIPHGNYMFFNEINGPVTVPPADAVCPSVLFFGYIRRYKGLIHLIHAFAKVSRRLPAARLDIVGKPVEDFTPYRREIERLGLSDRVRCELGYVPLEKVAEYFVRARVVALPYLKVFQSGVLQLAYGFGKPVVVTDCGGLPEAVVDGKSGFIVPCGDEEALAEKLLAVLEDAGGARMGDYARELAATKFSWEHIGKATDELYRELQP